MTSDHKNTPFETAKLFARSRKVSIGITGVGIILILLAFRALGKLSDSDGGLITHAVTRGNLTIDVVESGSIEASDSEIIRSKVEGSTTIISIIPEGTIITQKDIEEGRILVELDSSNLREREVQKEVSVASELAKYTDAQASYEIQKNQNESNLKTGELNVKFAKMDMEKYLGKNAAILFIEGKEKLSSLLSSEHLGGEALQRRRQLENDIALAKEEAARASIKLDWTQKLYDKGYVTRDDLQADELALKRKKVEQEQAETALALFKRYEFQKEAEQLRSGYEEAAKELERIIAKNRAEISKAEARLKSSEATYKNQLAQLDKTRDQIENCTIRAPTPGLVVYAGISNRWQTDQIAEGKKVREQQEIIQIPNTSSMVVKTSIHESIIARIHENQQAFITIDSLPDLRLDGKVTKVAILPDSQQWWLNPNLKVYSTDIAILGNHPNLKPGMSAQARIIINELKDVLIIPLQAVTTQGSDRVCHVKTAFGSERRIIETGDYNDNFIEVRSGLKEGEEVILNIQDIKPDDQVFQPKTDEEADAMDSEKELPAALYTWTERSMTPDKARKKRGKSGMKRKRPNADH